jgi:hypothetical protein
LSIQLSLPQISLVDEAVLKKEVVIAEGVVKRDVVVAEGEGYKIELKKQASDIDKDIVAFANSSGGRIFTAIFKRPPQGAQRVTEKVTENQKSRNDVLKYVNTYLIFSRDF